MYVQLTCAIVDADGTNRQELAAFLARNGVQVIAQLANTDGLAALVSRPDAPQLIIINLDPGAGERGGPTAFDMLRKVGHLPRQCTSIKIGRAHV